jgi:hypothetical protein
MYFGPSISVGRRGVSYGDSDAQAFIAATGLTGTTEVNAVNNLVANLKSYGLWSKMKAIYPFVSDTYNLLSYTSDYANAYWTKNSITLTQNVGTAPDGTNTANKITETAVSSGHWLKTASTLTAGLTYTVSGYFKAAERQYAVLIDDDAGVHTAFFNLSTGTLVSQSGYTSTSITSVGNGWYRCSATRNAATVVSNYYWATSSNGSTYNYLGDGTSGIFTWGFQFEQGALTTYQPIATTPANRFVSQFKYNLKDARDLDAAFRLAFNGTWTYSKQGATPNGVNAYADSYLIPNTSLTLNNTNFGYYSRTNSAQSPTATEMAVGYANGLMYLRTKNSSGNAEGYSYSLTAATVANANSQGWYNVSRISDSSLKLYKNGSSIAAVLTTQTGLLPPYKFYISAVNYAGTVGEYSNKEMAFSTIGDGLTDTEATNLYTSVQLFQQELARYVGVPIVSDANAQAFLDAAVITDQTQANAVNTLVTDLKTYGLWTKMKAIYPFVGGTATTHKWNLKDPRDLDAAYRLAFSGAWTHSSTGALPNGANAYANTFFNQQGNWTSTSNGAMGLYLRTNSVGAYCDMGAGTISTGANSSIIFARYTGDVVFSGLNCTAVTPGSANTNSQGFHAVSRTNSTSYSRYKRGSSTIDVTNTDAIGSNANRTIYLGAGQGVTLPENYSNRQIAYSFLGDGLTQSEIDLYYTAVQNFQTSLSRQV